MEGDVLRRDNLLGRWRLLGRWKLRHAVWHAESRTLQFAPAGTGSNRRGSIATVAITSAQSLEDEEGKKPHRLRFYVRGQAAPIECAAPDADAKSGWLDAVSPGWRLKEAIEALKAAAPEEVRTVLNGGLDAVYATDEHKRVSRVVAEWLVDALAKAHSDPAL